MVCFTTTDDLTDRIDRLNTRQSDLWQFQHRLDMWARLAGEIATDQTLDPDHVAADLAVYYIVGNDPMGCLSLERVFHDLSMFAQLAEDDLEESVADFHVEGDREFLDSISLMGSPMDVTHHVYYTLGQVYAMALKPRVIDHIGAEAVYEAVYRKMYEVVRDPRPVLYQIQMEYEGAISPRELVEDYANDGDGIAWEMSNVTAIAEELIETWLACYDDASEYCTHEAVLLERVRNVYGRDLDTILSDVEARAEADEDGEAEPEAC